MAIIFQEFCQSNNQIITEYLTEIFVLYNLDFTFWGFATIEGERGHNEQSILWEKSVGLFLRPVLYISN